MNQGFPLAPPTSYYQRVVDIGYRDFDLDRQILRRAYEETLEGLIKKRKALD
ncbi:MAG: hypothetical protein ACI4NI_01885 [Candidatus Ornithospirochaeta sp.]